MPTAAPPSTRSPVGLAVRLRELSDRLVRAATATGALQAWCEEIGLARGPVYVARREPRALHQLDEEARSALLPQAGEQVSARSVRLLCGALALSEADLRFLPSRLPPAVRETLETTAVPFGAAVQALAPRRRTYFVGFRRLDGADDSAQDAELAGLPASEVVLEHKAVVLDRQGRPLAVAAERYLAGLLGAEAG